MSADNWYAAMRKSTILHFTNASASSYGKRRNESLLYALELLGLEFKQLQDDEYCLNLCFFNFQSRRFGGSQWTQNYRARNSKILLNQHFNFRIPVTNNTGTVLVAELGDKSRNALCWTTIPIGGIAEPIEVPSGNTASMREQFKKSFPLFAGSCRVLLLANNFAQLEPHLRRLDAIMTVCLRLRSATTSTSHEEQQKMLLPDFYIMPAESADIEAPALSPSFTALLDNLQLAFANGGQRCSDAFLLDLLAREFCYATNEKYKPGEPTSELRVLERRLKIGAHNGLTFLDEPICLLLEPFSDVLADGQRSATVSGGGSRQRSRSLGRAEEFRIDFGARQSVRLRALPLTENLSIVFQLEYLIGCPVGNGQELLTNARLIRVAWTAWSPCGAAGSVDGQIGIRQADTITLQLLGGPRPAPAPFGLCLRDISVLPAASTSRWPPLPPSRVRMDLHFNFVPLPENEDGGVLGLSQLSGGLHQQPTPLPRPDRLPVDVVDVDEQPQQQRQQQRPPSAPSASSLSSARSIAHAEATVAAAAGASFVPTELDELAESTMRDNFHDEALLWPTQSDIDVRQPPTYQNHHHQQQINAGSAIRIELPLGRVHPLPRSLITQLARFPPITTNTLGGVSPQPVDVQLSGRRPPADPLDIELEWRTGNRAVGCAELSIQFLAFLPPAPSGVCFPRAQQPVRLFFSFQLFRFLPTITECLFTESLEPNQQQQQKPALLWREGAQQPGLTIRFTVGSEQLQELASYLLDQQLHIHVWEADSLFHLGVVSVPLKFLLRQGSPAVQCSAQCPVFQAGFPPSWSPAQQQQQGPPMNGLLFLRVANAAGLSSSAVGKVAKGGIAPRREKRVRSLHVGQQSALERFMALQRLDFAQRSARLFGPEEEKRLQEWTKLKSNNQQPKSAEEEKKLSSMLGGESTKKFLFAEELAAYRAMRREGKALALLKAVFSSITSTVQLCLTLGQVQFFSFRLKNPLAEECVCELETNDTRLSPIVLPEELKCFCQQRGIALITENIWQPTSAAGGDQTKGGDQRRWRIGLRPMEQLDVPMRFDPGVDERECNGEAEQPMAAAECRAFVRQAPAGHPMAIMELRASIQRPSLAQDLRWFTEECRKLVRTVPLPRAAHGLRWSDPTVHCQLIDGGRLLRVECQSGEAPHLREFLLFLFDSPLANHQLKMMVWRISIHSLGHIHSETVQGQSTRIPLPMPRSTSPAAADGELIRLFCSSPPPLSSFRFLPGPAFPAIAQLNVQPALLLSLSQLGRFHLLVNAVFASSQQPCGQWLCTLDVGQPNVTKVFQVIVPSQVQTTVHKRIPLDNPLSIARRFLLNSSDPKLLAVADPSPKAIPPNASVPILLDIHPPPSRPAQCQALLFVQDAETGNQEEAFQLNIRFH